MPGLLEFNGGFFFHCFLGVFCVCFSDVVGVGLSVGFCLFLSFFFVSWLLFSLPGFLFVFI